MISSILLQGIPRHDTRIFEVREAFKRTSFPGFRADISAHISKKTPPASLPGGPPRAPAGGLRACGAQTLLTSPVAVPATNAGALIITLLHTFVLVYRCTTAINSPKEQSSKRMKSGSAIFFSTAQDKPSFLQAHAGVYQPPPRAPPHNHQHYHGMYMVVMVVVVVVVTVCTTKRCAFLEPNFDESNIVTQQYGWVVLGNSRGSRRADLGGACR